MATFQAQSGFTTDPETGCVRGYNDYEQCRTNYFLKQQNEMLQNQKQQGVSNNGNENGDVGVMSTTTEAQIQQQPNNNFDAVETATGGLNLTVAYVLVLIAAIIATAVVTKYLTKRN